MTRNSRNPRHRRRIEASITKQLKFKILIGCGIAFAVILIIALMITSNGNRHRGQNAESVTEAYDVASTENTAEPKEKVSFVLTAFR